MSDAKSPDLAIVTGASSGIGSAIARGLAARGCHVVLVARRRDALQRVVDSFPQGTRSTIVCADLTNVEDAASQLAPVLDRLGPACVLINGAGQGLYRPFMSTTPQHHQRLMNLHYHAPSELIRLVLPGMLEAQRGTVINIASISTKIGPWGHGPYAASKAAMVSLTQTLAAEYGARGIDFCYVNPGIVQTDFFDDQAMAELWQRVRHHAISPQRVARAVVALLDRPRLETCVPWHYRALNWIEALSPTLAAWLVARNSRPTPLPAMSNDPNETTDTSRDSDDVPQPLMATKPPALK